METQEMNDLLTLVGPGQPAGELLRRYWYPVAVARELTNEQPTRFVRLLGEDLVLFRDKSGRVGLLADHCAHRSASLVYGRVEERGIACAYHGWLYDTEGNVLETPPERNEAIIHSVKQKAYPVQEMVGLFWAYLGPLPAPVIPKYDVWARRDGTRKIWVQPLLDCNWLQPTENSMDPAHAHILHQGFRKVVSTTRGNIDDVAQFDFYELPYGLMKKRVLKSGVIDEHPLIFPNILRHFRETQVRVPIDDTHTQIFIIDFYPTADGSEPADDELEVEYVDPFKSPADALHPFTRFQLRPPWLKGHTAQPEDHMAWETQGPIADRTREHLSYSDKGIALLRRVLRENIMKVQAGEDPKGVVRDVDHPIIDTNLDESLRLEGRRDDSAMESVAIPAGVPGPFQWNEEDS